MNVICKLTVLSVLMSILALGNTVGYAQDSFRSLGAGDLFEKTMDDLDTVQANATQTNDDTAQKNRQLKKDLVALDDQLEALTDTLTEVKRETLRLTDEITLDDKKTKLSQLRVKNFTTHKNQLEEEVHRLENRLTMMLQDNQTVQNQIAQLSKDVSGREPTAQGIAPLGSSAALLQEQANLKNQLAQKQKSVVDLQSQLAELGEQQTVIKNQLTGSQKGNTALMDQMTNLENQLNQLQSQEKLIRREIAAKQESPADADSLQDEIVQLRSEVQDLKATITKLKKFTAQFKPAANASIKKMESSAKLFSDYNALLLKRLNTLQRKMPQSSSIKNSKYESQYKDLAAVKQDLLLQNLDLDTKIKSIPVPLNQKQSQLESQIKETQARISQIESKWVQLKLKNTDLARVESLSKEVVALQTQFKSLKEQAAKLMELPAPAIDPQEEAFLKESINQLQLRRSILDSSLTSITNKYNREDISPDKIHEQEGKLSEYIKVLQSENAALQEKLLTLQMRSDKETN